MAMNAVLDVDALLRSRRVEYTDLWHDRSARRRRRPAAALPGTQVARTVLLAEDHGHALAVIPRDRHIDLEAIEQEFGRRLWMADRADVSRLFPGLPPRALPPIAEALQLETFVDQALVPLSEVCFETADPCRLVRLDGESFRALMNNAWCGPISRPES
jgi:prolyl-tRNA editing enzyme YbaK/EbsC (Cys-tRNA(Pro) deacylase)